MTSWKNASARPVMGVLWAAALIALACCTAEIGRVRNSPEVARDFEDLRVNPNYRYWFLNQENAPYGVAGLERGYRIEGYLWRELDPNSPTFRKVVGLVADFPWVNSTTSGFSILDPQGRTIGVWYSSLQAGITVDPETQLVFITTATPWIGPKGAR
jgi:hypothetical protein